MTSCVMRVACSDPPDSRTLGLAQIALVWLGRQASLVKACSLFPASCNRGVRCRRIWRRAGPRLSTPSFQYADASRTLPSGPALLGDRGFSIALRSALRVLWFGTAVHLTPGRSLTAGEERPCRKALANAIPDIAPVLTALYLPVVPS